MTRPYRGKKVTVMGLGAFGGGAGVTHFLVEQDARVLVTDLRPRDQLARGLDAIAGLPVDLVLEEHRERDFTDTDLVVANPAVPPDSPYLKIAEQRGVPIETEIALFLQHLPGNPVIGVTGSNGKTTTSHLIHCMLAAAGHRAWLGGNMGGSLLTGLSRIEQGDPVVLELSSFQLERLGPRGLGPDVAVVTNLTPNHLDRHVTFDAYAEAKAGIFTRARGAVLNAEDRESMDRFSRLPLDQVHFSSTQAVEEGLYLANGQIVEHRNGMAAPVLDTAAVHLPGRFNLENLMAALGAVRLFQAADPLPETALAAGAAFEGVPHRLELIATHNGVRYINDSIATTPESCLAALDAIQGPIHLIAGGYDKGLSLEGLARAIVERVSTVHLIGETGETLEQSIRAAARGLDRPLPALHRSGHLEAAVGEAARTARAGSSVLLSPGFASYDQFLNFEERGDCFRRSIAAL